MAKESYRIAGSGPSPAEADKVLEAEHKKLVDRVGNPTDVTVNKESYSAAFELKEGIDPSTVDTTSFKTAGSDWADIDQKFQRVKDGGQYTGRYTVERFLELTPEQVKATRGEKRSPAGYESSRTSSLSGLERLRI